jgi:hypothetical protein
MYRVTRVETIGDATLYLADCRDLLRDQVIEPDIPFVITDPPYGIGYQINERKPRGGLDWWKQMQTEKRGRINLGTPYDHGDEMSDEREFAATEARSVSDNWYPGTDCARAVALFLEEYLHHIRDPNDTDCAMADAARLLRSQEEELRNVRAHTKEWFDKYQALKASKNG